MIDVSAQTLRNWEKAGKLIPDYKTSSGYRYYSQEQVDTITGNGANKDSDKKKLTLVYCRVSSVNQRDDLKSQQLAMEQFCLAKGLAVDEYLSEIGSGMNFKRPIFLDIMNKIENEEVTTLVIAHKDRLCRFGFEFFEYFAKEHGCNLIVVNQPSLSSQEEMVEDMLSIVHIFSSKLPRLEKHKKEIKEFING